MKVQKIKKGRHFVRFWDRFWMPNTTKAKERVHIVMTGPGIRYDHGNTDQLDWNKLPAGKYFDWYNPHGKTAMIGWRYNTELDAIEITPYYHNIIDTQGYKAVGSVPGYYREDNILSIPIVEGSAHIGIDYTIQADEVMTEFYGLRDLSRVKTDKVEFEQIGALHTISNAYFGGNRRAENDMRFELMIF